MKVKFNQNLGTEDAKACSLATKSRIEADTCKLGAVVDISDEAFVWLTTKYKALVDVVEDVKGVAKDAKLTGPAK